GPVPRSSKPFLNFKDRGRKGRKTRSGRVYWADKTYSDRRVLLHIPRGFDTGKPGVIVLFFHGHGATLARDVVPRQRLPAQISNSGLNAVLVAPQFAVDARDSSAGNFWKPGGTRRFLNEVAPQLARLLGDPQAGDVFAKMPVVIVGYSGGYVPAAWTLANGGIEKRVKGVVLLDGLYGELGKFAKWIERKNSGFFLSAYATSTRKGNAALQRMLQQRGIPYTTKLEPALRPGSVTFIKAVKGHRDYVTRAWAENPVSDLLARIPGIAPRIDPARSAFLAPGLAN
ncbi:MAG: alpha/beta hydrolase, partial [Alphaproteobacteria bacterium]